MYDFIQSALTAATEVIAIAGITGIAAHAVWKQHTNWMSAYCPPVKAENLTTDEELAHYIDQLTHGEESVPEELISEIAREVIESLTEEVEPVTKPQPTPIDLNALDAASDPMSRASFKQPTPIDLSALDAATLRKLCSQYKIQWRDVRGKNRHATKGMMIFQLNQKSVA